MLINYFDYIRKTGYAFLFLALIEFLNILLFPKFTDPVWELQAMGRLIDLVWAPLLGFLLIFIPPEFTEGISPKEWMFLRILSWIAFFIGILYLLMVPLIIIDGTRISRNNNAQLITQNYIQQKQLEQAEQQIRKISTQDLEKLNKQGKAPTISSSEQLREKLLSQLNQKYKSGQAQVKTVFEERQKELLRSTIKWGVGAAISATIMICVWLLSAWTRTIIS